MALSLCEERLLTEDYYDWVDLIFYTNSKSNQWVPVIFV
jgi:hypothetical protein